MFFATFYIIANIFQSYELWLLYRCFFGKSKRGIMAQLSRQKFDVFIMN